MIARAWHGVTAAEHADVYLEYLNRTGVQDYQQTEGNRGVYVLRRLEGERADFLLISLWESYDAIRKFYQEVWDTGEALSITGDHYWDVRKALYRTMGLPALWKIEADTVEDVAEPEIALPSTHMSETA